VLVHRALVERVDLGDVGHAARRGHLGRHGLEWRERATGQEEPGALAGEGLGDAAAHAAAGAVDHDVLVLENSSHGP
jgi:hypothetical protein